MRTPIGAAQILSLSLLVASCGITTSSPQGISDDIEQAASDTAALAAYEFTWTADYVLTESETGRSELTVRGSGSVDAEKGDVDSVVSYDDDLLPAARALFPDDDIDEVLAFTKVVGDEIFVRGFNVASLAGDVTPSYDEWYEIGRRSQDLGDPFVRSDVLPVDVLPVAVEPLVDAGELSLTVDRDFVLDLGTRFAQSLYDFGLRLGGGDFQLSVELRDGLVGSLTMDGDDPGAGVERFTFEIEFFPVAEVEVEVPPEPLRLP